MVLITQRLKRGPVDSRVGMFPEDFGMADGRSESTEGRSKLGVGWRLTSGELEKLIVRKTLTRVWTSYFYRVKRREWYCMQSRGSQVIWVGETR